MLETGDGIPLLISDYSSRFCPDDDVHCVQCPYLSDQKCPLELGIVTQVR